MLSNLQKLPEVWGKISWETLVHRINNAAESALLIVQIQNRETGALSRGRLSSARVSCLKLVLESPELHAFRCYDGDRCEWKGIGYVQHEVTILKITPPPISLPDGRIIFSAQGFDYIIFQEGDGADCPS